MSDTQTATDWQTTSDWQQDDLQIRRVQTETACCFGLMQVPPWVSVWHTYEVRSQGMLLERRNFAVNWFTDWFPADAELLVLS